MKNKGEDCRGLKEAFKEAVGEIKMQIMDLKRLKIKRGIVRTVTTKLTQKIVD